MALTTPITSLTAISPSAPSTPRLRMEPTGARSSLLDGGWWPRSTDPVAELPGLVLAIDRLRGRVARLRLTAEGWEEHPRRLGVAGRVLRVGYFTGQPAGLLTALCENGKRVDLLVVPPDTPDETADAAMLLAVTTANRIHARDILRATGAPHADQTDGVPGVVVQRYGVQPHAVRHLSVLPGGVEAATEGVPTS